MADTKSIRVSTKLAKTVTNRFDGIEATLRCIGAGLRSHSEHADNNAAQAIELVAEEVSRLACDLDVCAWRDAHAGCA